MRTPVLLAFLLAIAPAALLAQGPTTSSADTTIVGIRAPDYGSVGEVTRNHLYDKWQLHVSVAGLLLSTTVRVDPDSGEGTELNSEDDLGFGNTVVRPRFAVRWRPGRRHELEVSWLFVNRNADRILVDTIQVGDTSFSAGARLQSDLRNDQVGLVYRWAFHATDKSQIGLGVGLGAQVFHFKWDASAGATNGSDTASVQRTIEKRLTGPTGSLGLYGRWQLSPAWIIEADLRGIYAKISTVTVWDLEGGAAARYWLNNTWGFEAGYGLGLYDVKIEASNSESLIQYNFVGRIKYSTQNLRLGVNIAL